MSNIDTLAYSKAGRIFTGNGISAKIITVVGTSMTGGTLYNPIGSGRKLIMMHAGWSWTTASPSAQSIGLAIGAYSIIIPTSTGVSTSAVQCTDGSGAAGVAKFWDAATLPVAPVACRWFAGANWVTGGSGTFPYMVSDNIDGALSLVPGASLSFCMIGGTGPTGLPSMTWIEADL
jgi:hypothetical protein